MQQLPAVAVRRPLESSASTTRLQRLRLDGCGCDSDSGSVAMVALRVVWQLPEELRRLNAVLRLSTTCGGDHDGDDTASA